MPPPPTSFGCPIAQRPSALACARSSAMRAAPGSPVDPPRVHLLLARDDPLLHELEEPVADRADVLGNGKIHAPCSLSPLDGHGKGFRAAQRSAARARGLDVEELDVAGALDDDVERDAHLLASEPGAEAEVLTEAEGRASPGAGGRGRSGRGRGTWPDRGRRRRTSTPSARRVGARHRGTPRPRPAPGGGGCRPAAPSAGPPRSPSRARRRRRGPRASSSGRSNRAKNRLPIAFVVLWVPAGNSRRRNERISSSASLRPWNSPRTNVLTRSSPGSSRRCCMTGSRNSVNSALAANAPSGSNGYVNNAFDHRSSASESSAGRPSSRVITSIGRQWVSTARRSTGEAPANRSTTWWHTGSSTSWRYAAMRWRRNVGDTTARLRVCSSPCIELSVRPVAGSVVRAVRRHRREGLLVAQRVAQGLVGEDDPRPLAVAADLDDRPFLAHRGEDLVHGRDVVHGDVDLGMRHPWSPHADRRAARGCGVHNVSKLSTPVPGAAGPRIGGGGWPRRSRTPAGWRRGCPGSSPPGARGATVAAVRTARRRQVEPHLPRRPRTPARRSW